MTLRGTEEIMALFYRARELLGVQEWYEVLERAEKECVKAIETYSFDYRNLAKSSFPCEYDGIVPTMLKIRVPQIDGHLNELLKDFFQIQSIKAPWKCKVVLKNLIFLLEQSNPVAEGSLQSLKLKAVQEIISIKDEEKIKAVLSILKEGKCIHNGEK